MECLNERPIIGILAQEITDLISKKYPYSKSYIAASYVKAVESSGARVVPIFLDKSEEYYRNTIHSINGLVLPGGNTWFYKFDDKTPKEYGYLRAAEIIYAEVKKINEANEGSFPILGICLGMEVMLFLDAKKQDYREKYKSGQNTTVLPLEFCEKYEKSSIFSNLKDDSIISILKQPVNYFSHQIYVTLEVIGKQYFEEWRTLTASEEKKENVKFASIIESRKYPFLGLQFHPEKAYEWSTRLKNSHSQEALKTCRFFFDWLVMQSKQNKNKFSSLESENKSLINNYQKTFTAEKLNFDELYLFDENNSSLIIVKNSSLIQCVM